MGSRSRGRWLDEGLAALAEDGANGVKIDRLVDRVGLSKGSFHHHFAGAADFKEALLQHYEERVVSVLRESVARPTGGSPRAVLAYLTDLIGAEGSDLYDPDLDLAVRVWAAHDAQVREVVARIDAARIGELESVWAQLGGARDEIEAAALLPYLVHLGATVLVPNPSSERLGDVYQLLLGLVPEGERDSDCQR